MTTDTISPQTQHAASGGSSLPYSANTAPTAPTTAATSTHRKSWRSKPDSHSNLSQHPPLHATDSSAHGNNDNNNRTLQREEHYNHHSSSIGSNHHPPPRQTSSWWRIRWFRGMNDDVRRRLPFYWSDWRDAWDYRVVPATVYMYFANILPALAFSLDMFEKTAMSYGVNEVLLASVLGAVVFAVAAAQPLVIVGVTGPITVFNYTVYDIMAPTGVNYFAFMCLIGLWAMIFHFFLAINNSSNALRYVTRFSCDIFGFYVAFIYLQKGIQVLTRQPAGEAFYLSIVIALLVLMVGYLCGLIGESPLFQHYIRVFIKDYGTPLTIVFFTGFVHIGKMASVELEVLPTTKAFSPTSDRGWFVHFWDVRVADVFIAIPFAILLTILFWFDHNVSSLIAQGTEFPLRKPAGFHWDIFLLGLTTGIAGLLGIPFPNGLIPQAPFHTASLCVTKVVSADSSDDDEGASKGHVVTIIDHVVEQRFSNLAQGILTLGTMTGPLLIVLHLIPQGVLAGLFFVMGVQALEGNGMTLKILFLLKDASLTPASDPLKRIARRRTIWAFVAIQLLGFGATFAITQTIAAVGFPVFILLLIPVRAVLLPRWFAEEDLRILDAPTASPFTMVSVGGNYGEEGHGEASGAGVGGQGGGIIGRGTEESSEAEEAAERGERPGVGMSGDWVAAHGRGRGSRRVGAGGGGSGSLEEHEMGDVEVFAKEDERKLRRRSVSRQS